MTRWKGLRFVRSEPVLLGAISLDLVAVLFGGAVALLPAIAEDRLGVGAVGLGWLRAAVGIGAGLVTLLLAFKPVTRRVGSVMLIAVGIFGVGTIVLGLTTSYVIAFVALAVLSGADAISVFIRGTLVPLVTPPDKRGRVLAVETVFIGASNELGAFESGVAGQLLGPAAAIVIGGAVTLGIALSWSKLFPALRAVDRFPEGRHLRRRSQLNPTSSAWCSYSKRQPTSRKPASSSQPSWVSSSSAPGNTRSRLAKQPPGATSGRISP